MTSPSIAVIAACPFLGSAPVVMYTGIANFFQRIDYLIKAFSIVVKEMISGKPIVCFAGGAKFLTHMQDALIVADHDWRAMGEAILTFLRDPDLAKRLGDNGRAYARVVRRGLMADGMIEILDGLEESDEVVRVGQLDLRDNDRVNVNHSGPWNK